MKRFYWQHPSYVKQSNDKLTNNDKPYDIALGQKRDAQKFGFQVVTKLNTIGLNDFLVIAGHTLSNDNPDDDGKQIQGQSEDDIVKTLKNAGLKIAPNFISLECCQAATEGGIALELSKHPFFKDTIIEATETSIAPPTNT